MLSTCRSEKIAAQRCLHLPLLADRSRSTPSSSSGCRSRHRRFTDASSSATAATLRAADCSIARCTGEDAKQ